MMNIKIAELNDRLTVQDDGIGHKAGPNVRAMWCGLMHDSPMWPIHGRYECRTCGRVWPVRWSDEGPMRMPLDRVPASASQTLVSYLRAALLPIAIILAILLPLHVEAAEALMADSNDRAPMVFARYMTGLGQTAPWNVETIEIEASLPRLEGNARLRAIRRLLPQGKPKYQVLESVGDQTVKEQVIFRYLSGDTKAADIPAASVAITPANYNFSYKGARNNAGVMAYVFGIKPRKKRTGLIRGELWIDDNGAVVRESGYLVKSPSIFVKRVNVTRETDVREGQPEERTTHLSIDARLVGRAELTIHERPIAE
jgi:hypothetical protein